MSKSLIGPNAVADDVLYVKVEVDEYEGLSGTSAIVYVKVLVVPTDTLYSPL